jgi:hypothetical protein
MLSADLIKELDKAYPDQCPSLSLSEREVWFKAGQRSVVNSLLMRQAKPKKRKAGGIEIVVGHELGGAELTTQEV